MVLPKGRDLRKELSTSVAGALHEKIVDINTPNMNLKNKSKSLSSNGKW